MVSIPLLTFYIINQLPIIILRSIWLVIIIFKIKYCQTEVLKQPRDGSHAFNVMVICNQRHANVSKQRTLLADVDVVSSHGAA